MNVEVESSAVLDLQAAALAVVQLVAVIAEEPAKSAGEVGSKAGQVEGHGGLQGNGQEGVAAASSALLSGFVGFPQKGQNEAMTFIVFPFT